MKHFLTLRKSRPVGNDIGLIQRHLTKGPEMPGMSSAQKLRLGD
jgi:hypothetical protein